jgi:CheY-like chemotaxis protein
MSRRRSLRWRITLVVMTTTATALLLSATSLLIYELRSYRNAWAADLTTQADLIASSSAAALAFDDARAANEVLARLRLRPQIEAAAIYTTAGKQFASYAAPGVSPLALPVVLRPDGTRFEGDSLELFQKVEQNNQRVGTVYLAAHYDVGGRLRDYVAILFAVTLASLALAALVFSSLESTLTQPILALAQVARDVVRRRDYRLRVAKTTDDEVGVLVDSFNDMLHDLDVEMTHRQKAENALRTADRRKDEFPCDPGARAAQSARPARHRARGAEEGRCRPGGPGARARSDEPAAEADGASDRRPARRLAHYHQQAAAAPRRARPRRPSSTTRSRSPSRPCASASRCLETSWPDGAVWVEGDATRLTQVVVNLLNNAVKYTEARRPHLGGAAGRSRQRHRSRARQRHRHRSGAAGRDLRHVHAGRQLAGARARRTRRRALAGQAPGRTARGAIEVESAGPGRGSQFSVTVPTVAAPSFRTERPAGAEHRDRGALQILVADDNVDLATSLADMLSVLGHSVRVVHDGRAAFAAATEAPPDVALFDIGMPLMNGYELAQRLRKEPSTRTLPMVAITGWGQDSDRERARAAGFDRHLVKPVDPDELAEVLRSLGQRPSGAVVAAP